VPAGPSRYRAWYGRDEPPVEPRALAAGALRATLVGPDLRDVRWSGVEIASRIYVGVRDAGWGTILPAPPVVEVEEARDQFVVRLQVSHRRDPIAFAWRGTIVGRADGRLDYAFEGQTEGAFDYARIGLCVHHPLASRGRPYHAITPDGRVAGRFPDTVAPQIHFEDVDLPVFPPFTRLTVRQSDEVEVELAFEGDRFELEDHRNWTDANFKTYGGPADIGYLLHATDGERIAQRVVLTARGRSPTSPRARRPRTPAPLRIEIGDSLGGPLPTLGLAMASHGMPLGDRDSALLRAMRPAHLRADIGLGDDGWTAALGRARDQAGALDCPLELAVHLGPRPEVELTALARELAARPVPVARILAFREGEEATYPVWLSAVRGQLAEHTGNAPVFGGADSDFAEVNRHRWCVEGADGLAYAVDPQTHAFDDRSIAENLVGQAETVRTARTFAGSLPIAISPLTLRPRRPPAGIEPRDGGDRAGLPYAVDVRQASLFAAAWTAASIGELARAGVASLTYYETTGWRGILESDRETHPPLPAFPPPGAVFPIYHVLRDVISWSAHQLCGLDLPDGAVVGGIALGTGRTRAGIIANLTPQPRAIEIAPWPSRAGMRRLAEGTLGQAMHDPEGFRSAAESIEPARGHLRLSLAPFETIRLETEPPA
jgi:hypothetical protein